MESTLALLALSLPALLGIAWVAPLIPKGEQARIPLVLGHGLLAGLIALPLLMRLLNAAGLPITFSFTATLAVLVTLAAVPLLMRNRSVRMATVPIEDSKLQGWERYLFALLLVIISLRIATLALELLGRPLFPWDATMHWATKARVWFEHGKISPFVSNLEWLIRGGEGVYTDHHPEYPMTTPLLQTWMTSAVGSWNESLMNLPWLLCLLGLGLSFFAQLRRAGSEPLTALVLTYFLLSMPLLNIHVALAGYADLFLGAVYCAALMAFHNWSLRRERWQGFLAVFFALSCLFIKNEGFFWLMTFLPALMLVLLPPRRALSVMLVLAVALSLTLYLIPSDFTVAGHTLDRLEISYRPGALAGIAASFWWHDNWHLFAYFLVAVLPLSLIVAPRAWYRNRGILMALASALILFLILFVYTRYSLGAMRFTAVGRISLHLVPGMLFLVGLFWMEISRGSRGRISDQESSVSRDVEA